MPADLYAILEVSPRASDEVIHAAYRLLAKRYADDNRHLAELNKAKQTLLSPDERSKYDESMRSDPKQIGPYRIKREIASGGFGKTYYAEHSLLGMPVCIKHGHLVSPQDEAILMEEAKAIWDLRHCGIPSIRDILRVKDGSLALVMSYVPGKTIGQWLEKHDKMEPEHVAWVIDRAMNVLKYLHLHGVVHGDVKPQNIMICDEDHSVTLVDYGLSAIRPSATDSNKGHTPFFAPPEQIAGKVLLPESDFFSLGVTMIAALGGDIEHRNVPSKTPQAMCDLIKRLIVYDVLRRPSWDGPCKEDLCETVRQMRVKAFGRDSTNMAPFKF